ncbi:MAG TPA: TRAP transporter substrate-binding protein DctP [Burkholderiales bacterium]|nr:TRAP transporter substrate-binding protein DctP [Burkholderiales bacterium]
MLVIRIIVALILGVLGQAVQAEAVKVRLGALAPRGTAWHRSLLEMGEKWRAAEGAGAEFTVYGGGSQGGEADMVRRLRVGQLNAAMLTVIGLTEIDPSVSALQKMPLIFRSWDELDYVRDKLRPALEKRFLERGFVVLCWGDAGWVRFFSKSPAARPQDYQHLKIFAWAGDAPQADIMKSLGYHPVVLEVADILPGLQTGMVNMVPTTPFWALTLQFYPHAPYMLELDWAPLVGAVIVTRKAWDAMTPAGRDALAKAGAEMGVQLRALSRREHEESVAAMTKRGLKVQKLTPELEAEWRRAAEEMYPLVRGHMVPADFFDEVQRLLGEYRARQGRTQ